MSHISHVAFISASDNGATLAVVADAKEATDTGDAAAPLISRSDPEPDAAIVAAEGIYMGSRIERWVYWLTPEPSRHEFTARA